MSPQRIETASIEQTLFPSLSLASRERAALDDAARLAEIWQHALAASFRLGYNGGHHDGWLAGRDEEATAWQAIVTGYSAVLAQPNRAELARVRAPRDKPCGRRCDACSQCTRAAAVGWNLTRYGSPNFPGVAARTLNQGGRS